MKAEQAKNVSAGSAVGKNENVEHWYGGPWTEIKLDAVEYFLQCYTRALKAARFDLTYIDAFAGTGSRVTQQVMPGILGERDVTIIETLAGSAERALNVQPPFDHLVFIEKDADRCRALEKLQRTHFSRDIKIIPGEANDILRDLVDQEPWSRKGNSRSRGVVFLDPYALQVDWETLRALAATRVFDVWYLFPIRDTIRQLARNFDGIGPKEPMLDRVLGPEWRELYAAAPNHQPRDLFDQPTPEPGLERVVTQQQFEQWLKRRLQREFAFVSDPLPIMTSSSRQAFSLFLGVSNPSAAAIDLAKKFSKHVNSKFAPWASRHSVGR